MINKSRNRCAIYVRVSVESVYTKKESIFNQVTYLTDYAKEHDFVVADIYSDNGYPGSNMERPELKRMLADAELGKFDIILVTNLSRFSRNYLDAGNYIETIFPKTGIRFIAPGDNYDSLTYKDEQAFTLRLWLNDMFLKDIGNKIRYANKKRAETTYMNRGGIYGLKKVNGEIVIDEEAADVVRLIFRLYLEGYTAYQTVKYLRENKIYSRSYYAYLKTGYVADFHGVDPSEVDPYHWPESVISRILRNKEYNGCAVNRPVIIKNAIKTRNPNRVYIPNALPKIIDDETFNEVQRRRDAKQISLARTSPIDRMPNVYCGVCGRKLSFNAHASAYRCLKCHKEVIRSKYLNPMLEKDLSSLIEEVVKDKASLKKKLMKQYKTTSNINISELISMKSDVDIKIQTLFESHIIGEIDEHTYNEKLAQLSDLSNKLESEINIYNSNKKNVIPSDKEINDFIIKLKELPLKYDNTNLEVFKKLISKLVIERVAKKNYKVTITYNFKM